MSPFNNNPWSSVNSYLTLKKWCAIWGPLWDAIRPTIEGDMVDCVKYGVSLSCASCYGDPIWYKADVLYVVMWSLGTFSLLRGNLSTKTISFPGLYIMF